MSVNFAGLRVLDELRKVQTNPNFAGAHEVRNAWIGRLLGIGWSQRRQQS